MMSSTSHIFSISLLFFITNLLLSVVYGYDGYSKCSSFRCGNFANIRYPFWANDRPEYCGHPGFKLDCNGDNVVIDIMNQKYHIINLDFEAQILKIARTDFWSGICPQSFVNITLNFSIFNITMNDQYATLLYDCDPIEDHPDNEFACPINNRLRYSYFTVPVISSNGTSRRCNISLSVPVLVVAIQGFMNDSMSIDQVLKGGFEVRWIINKLPCWNCINSGGMCGYNRTLNEFTCFCPDQAYTRTCSISQPIPSPRHQDFPAEGPTSDPRQGDRNIRMKLIIGFAAAFGGMGIMAAIFLIYLRRYKKRNFSSVFSRKTSSDPSSTEDFEKGDKFLGVHVFTYTELEEATNNFDSAKELGDGGFGTVYYGELLDGRAVAVKRLYENNYRRVEQFMNEVEILTRLRHQNLVSLYGCTSRHSRELLLVYEYIPNGTVADHLHGARAKPGEPFWPTRLMIAIDTAKALTYLHASDIIHRDVKTNNILLDNNFCVKVADFGLSRLFPNHVTHVSTAPQGTPGYVDPEYHQCYQLTDKSDVFSFGVVLVELISSMPAVDISRHRHEINLSNLAINKIQNKALHELVDSTLGYESDYNIRGMINAVAELAFQCLQSEKDMRPYMADVLETLKDIQNSGYNKAKEEEMDIPLEDVKILKSGTPEYSPDSEFCHSKLDHRKNKSNATN